MVSPEPQSLLNAARQRQVDVIVVWRLDRWGRSLSDLVVTLRELIDLGVGFVSLTEALDLNTPTGRAMAKKYRRPESCNLKPGFRTLAFSTKSTTSSDKSLIPLYRLQCTVCRASAVAHHQNAGSSQHVSAARAIRRV
jgi:hypothetical protein